MTADDARAISELASAIVGATLVDMRLSGVPRERMQRYLETISNSMEAVGSDSLLIEVFRAHLAAVAQILPPRVEKRP